VLILSEKKCKISFRQIFEIQSMDLEIYALSMNKGSLMLASTLFYFLFIDVDTLYSNPNVL